MLKLLKYFFCASIVVCTGTLLSGCEELVDPDGIPYVEKLVVRAVLVPDGKIDTFYISKTRSLTEPINEFAQVLQGVTGAIYEGTTAYPLKYIGSGGYIAEGLSVEQGKTYRLDAHWNNLHAEASTRIPIPTPIDSAHYHVRPRTPDDYFYGQDEIGVTFTPLAGQVYILTWGDSLSGRGSSYISSFEYDSRVARPQDADPDGKIRLNQRTNIYFSPEDSIRNLRAVLYSFDEPYYEYYISSQNFTSDESPVSSGSHFIRWNVTGDAIGMFIGQTISEYHFK